MVYHDGRHLFCMVVEVVTLTLPNEAVFFYLCKLAIQQTLSPLYNWFYIDFLGAKVELMNTGEVKYDDSIHDFSDFPKKAYKSVLQDIIDIYRRTRISVSDVSNESKMDNMQLNTFVLTKDVYKQYTTESKLTRILNPYNLEQSSEDSNLSNIYDDLCADFLSVVIGRSSFKSYKFLQLKNTIISMHEDYLKRIIETRLNAVIDYFSNNLNNCYQNIKNAYEEAKKEPRIPTWLLNDIVLDMRNINMAIDNLNNRVSLSSDAQTLLDDSPEIVYFPLLDRFDSSHRSDLLKKYFEKLTQSPYSYRFESIDNAFKYIASCFNIAVRFGSLTHILETPKRYGETLFVNFYNTGDFRLFFKLIKNLLVTNQVEKLKNIVDAFKKNVSSFTETEVDALINCIQAIPIESHKISAHLMVLEHFGYYFNENQFESETDFLFKFALQWCGNEKRNLSFGTRILNTVSKNLGRIDHQRVAELLICFFDHNLRRFYNDVLRVLSRLNLKQVNEKAQMKIIEHCITLMSNQSSFYKNILKDAIIAIRKTASINTEYLDNAVNNYLPEFYSKDYDLEINKTNLNWHIDYFTKEIDERNQQAQGSRYIGYAYNPCDVIKNIVEFSGIRLLEDNVIKLVSAIERTLLNNNQQVDQKCSAIRLAIYLYCQYPQITVWDEFKKTVSEKSDDILSANSSPILAIESHNTLKFNYLLMKIVFNLYSFEEAALGFATLMGFNDSDFIVSIRNLSSFLKVIDITTIDERVLGIVANFVLSIGKEKYRDAQIYAIDCLLVLSNTRLYAATVWERLAYMFNDTISEIKFKILKGIRNLETNKEIKNYILQKGRADNHYLVRDLSVEITESLS